MLFAILSSDRSAPVRCGLVGAGRTETFKIVSGVLKRGFFHGGEILLHDKPVRYRVPAPAVKAGIACVTEDRKVEGFFETSSIARNIYLGLLAKFPKGRIMMSGREAGGQRGEDYVCGDPLEAASAATGDRGQMTMRCGEAGCCG